MILGAFYLGVQAQTPENSVYHSPAISGHSLILFLSAFTDAFVSLKEF